MKLRPGEVKALSARQAQVPVLSSLTPKPVCHPLCYTALQIVELLVVIYIFIFAKMMA